ncbi:hypothetical protein PRUPE_2G232600 [Prunus persica]|uniref:Dolichyl-diphosphooligosaccharide--protein glycosyltransferase subunit 4 n=1 Tax=Prunus persica TaxID=3760 RepID=A0A251QKH4_PRUPE|nr:uncharacterized protein LOC109947700 [Prunus persica]ONI24292.1 hypothetical protein PRUPE_2G232600 [Prunus persica]
MLWLVHKSVFKWANNSGHKLTFFGVSGRSEKVNKKAVCFPLHLRISVTFQSWVLPLTICSQLQVSSHFIFTKMIDDQGLGIVANLLGIFIFVLVIAYHYVTADPKYEGN